MALVNLPDVIFAVTNLEGTHRLKVTAFFGATQSTSFNNAHKKLILVTNNNPDGVLGTGTELKGTSIPLVTVAQGDLDTLGPERVRLVYEIEEPAKTTQIQEYDKPEEDDATPFIMFNIHFV